MTKLKKYIEDYEIALDDYSNKLNKYRENINNALFLENLITITSNNNFVRMVENSKTNYYSIPIFTDESEIKIPENIKVDMKIITINEFIEIAKKDHYFEAIIVNPYTQNFKIDIKSIIEYSEIF